MARNISFLIAALFSLMLLFTYNSAICRAVHEQEKLSKLCHAYAERCGFKDLIFEFNDLSSMADNTAGDYSWWLKRIRLNKEIQQQLLDSIRYSHEPWCTCNPYALFVVLHEIGHHDAHTEYMQKKHAVAAGATVTASSVITMFMLRSPLAGFMTAVCLSLAVGFNKEAIFSYLEERYADRFAARNYRELFSFDQPTFERDFKRLYESYPDRGTIVYGNSLSGYQSFEKLMAYVQMLERKKRAELISMN